MHPAQLSSPGGVLDGIASFWLGCGMALKEYRQLGRCILASVFKVSIGVSLDRFD